MLCVGQILDVHASFRACVRSQHISRTAGSILIIFSPINSILYVVVHLILIFFNEKKTIFLHGFQLIKNSMSSGIAGGCMGLLYFYLECSIPVFLWHRILENGWADFNNFLTNQLHLECSCAPDIKKKYLNISNVRN